MDTPLCQDGQYGWLVSWSLRYEGYFPLEGKDSQTTSGREQRMRMLQIDHSHIRVHFHGHPLSR